MTSKELFFYFLQKEGCYITFIEEVTNVFGDDFADYFFKGLTPEEYLTSAFVWENTNQGRKFWEDLNKKWIDFLSNVNVGGK